MATHYRTRAFILRKGQRGEADSIVTAFSEDFGILRLRATSGRKIASKLRGGIEPISFSELEFVRGKVYNRVTDAVQIEAYGGIKQNLVRLRCAMAMTELLLDSLKGEMSDKNIWNLLKESFDTLNVSTAQSALLYYYFLWNLFSYLGYSMQFSYCVTCQNRIGKIGYSSFQDGGVRCGSCVVKKQEGVPMYTLYTIESLLQENASTVLARLRIDKQLHGFSVGYRSHILQIMQ